MSNIGILGAGSWGTALAKNLLCGGHAVTLYSALPAEIAQIAATHTHKNLPGMTVPDTLYLTEDIESAVKGKEVVVFAVASPYTRSTAEATAPFLKDGQIVVNVSKGLEPSTLMTQAEIIESVLASKEKKRIPVATLAGPTHAEEVALDLPTTIVAAHRDETVAKTVQKIFSSDSLRVYTNTDSKGVELCGALKNIVAIAAGISDGLGNGDNTKAAIITRGMAEIMRLGSQMGAKKETFTSLAGIGDLIVTCTSRHSRNNRTGYLIGQGVPPAEAIKQVGMAVEGVNALPAARMLSQKHGVEMPLCETVDAIIKGELTAKEALLRLMTRELKNEAE